LSGEIIPILVVRLDSTIRGVDTDSPVVASPDDPFDTFNLVSALPPTLKTPVDPILTLPPELITNGVLSGFVESSTTKAFPVPV
jgi:hypothetical protein